MSQIGKPHWNIKVKNRIDEVFYNLLIKIRNREQAMEFCEMVLTPTERINLPRRLGVFILLQEGVEQRSISELMHVSLATVGKISLKVKEKRLRWLKNFIEYVLAQEEPNRVVTKPRPVGQGGKFNPVKFKPDLDLPY